MADCPIPSNITPLSPTGFKLSISKLPEIDFFTQEVSLPEITLGSISVGTPFSVSQIAGDTLSFGDLSINFLVDEDMSNYKALYNWLIGLGFPANYEQYQNFTNAQGEARNIDPRLGQNILNYSDATLTILGNNNVPVQNISFLDLFPVSLGTLQFTANASDVNYLVANAVFRYTLFSLN